MNQKVAAGICSQVGTVIKKTEIEGEGGRFMRVRVRVDITIPLSRGRMVSLGQGKEIWVSFKYERLPNICYWFGRLNHDDRDCETWLESEGSLRVEDQQFDAWLRAAPISRTRKNVVTIPGLFKKRKGGSSTPKSPTIPRKAQAHTMAAQPPQRGLAEVEKIQSKTSITHSLGLVTKGTISCSYDSEQQQIHAEPLGNGESNLNNNPPINEARNECPSFCNSDLLHTNKEAIPSISPTETVH